MSLVLLALVFGKTAREQYYIWRLGSEDLAVSQRAATTLATMGSSRAFPYIVIVIDNAVVSQRIRLSGMSNGQPSYSHGEGSGRRAAEILGPYIWSLTEIVRKQPSQKNNSRITHCVRDTPHKLNSSHMNAVAGSCTFHRCPRMTL